MSLIIFPKARREFDILSRQRQRPILPGLVILGGSGLGMLIAALSHADPRLPALAGFIVYVLWSLRWMTASRPEHAMEGSDRE
jgi:CHASE2 domain-containing sensor protein